MQEASEYSAAKAMDMYNLVQTMMASSSKGDLPEEECHESAGSALQRWTQLKHATLQNKAFVSMLTDADDTQGQEALKETEAMGRTVEVEFDSDEGTD